MFRAEEVIENLRRIKLMIDHGRRLDTYRLDLLSICSR